MHFEKELCRFILLT